MNKIGQLIVLEGATDGIGKSTQLKMLQQHLEADGVRIAKHHFPTYYSYQGKGVEKYLAGEYGTPEEVSPYFVNSLYAYDRAITWRIKLKKLYDRGQTILLDRYTTSSLIYQSALIKSVRERRKFIDYVTDFEYNKLGIGQPNLVIFLQAPLELATELRRQRTENEGVANDIHETDKEFLQKVYDNALFVADYLHWTPINCANSDNTAIRNIEAIHKDIYRAVKSLT